MKKLHLLVISILFLSFTSAAQISKGMYFIGADLSGSFNKLRFDGDVISKSHSFTVGPLFGKVIKNNLLLGGKISYGQTRSEGGQPGSTVDGDLLQGGIFLRKYLPLGKSGFYFFGQGGLNYTHQTHDIEMSAPMIDKSKIRNLTLNVFPGVAFAITKRLHLETALSNLLSLTYENTTRLVGLSDSPSEYQQSGLSFSTNVNNNSYSGLNLGVRWFF